MKFFLTAAQGKKRYLCSDIFQGKFHTPKTLTSLKLTIIFSLSLFLLYSCNNSSGIKKLSEYPGMPLKTNASNISGSEVPEYNLGFGDVIEVKFFNNQQFNEILTVRPDGRISMQKVGDLFVTGMTPSQLDSLISKTYSRIIRNPDVTVFVREFGGYQVYVTGEVNSPGGYPVEREMTALQALALAGGSKDGAKLSSVMVLRKDKQGKPFALKLNLKKPLGGDFAFYSNNIVVQPQDIIYVPKTFVADASTFLQQVYDGLLPPVDIYYRALFWSDR